METYIIKNKQKKHTFTLNSLWFPAEMNTSGCNTPTTFIPFKTIHS